MGYLDVYKRKLQQNGGSVKGELRNHTITTTNQMFNDTESHRVAIINFDDTNSVDVRFSEDKGNLFRKYFLFRPEYKIQDGSYITIDEGTFIVDSHFLKDLYPKAETLICNMEIKTKGQTRPMPCHGNNTTYGTKGLKDNNNFKEPDAKLKIIIQANMDTIKYYEGMRILILNKSPFVTKKEYIAYKILKKDFSITNGYYILETELSAISPNDDLENGIAYNEGFDEVLPPVTYVINGADSIKSNNIEEYVINPTRSDVIFEVDDSTIAEIVEQGNGTCRLKGLKRNNYVALTVRSGQDILATYEIFVF